LPIISILTKCFYSVNWARPLAKQDIDNAIKMAEEKKASFTLPAELIQIEKQIRFEKLKKKMSDNLG